MWLVVPNINSRHPSFSVCVVKAVPVQLDVTGDNEPIDVVGRHSHLHLGRGLCSLVDQHGHLLAVGDALTALGGPDKEPLICVDVRGDVCKRQRGHGSGCAL